MADKPLYLCKNEGRNQVSTTTFNFKECYEGAWTNVFLIGLILPIKPLFGQLFANKKHKRGSNLNKIF